MRLPIPKGWAPLYYAIPVVFDTAVAGQASGTAIEKADSESGFVVQGINAVIAVSGVVLTSTINLTPFPRDAVTSPGTTGNTFPTINHFRFNVSTYSNDWFKNPVRVGAICGTAERPGLLGCERGIENGQDLKVTLYNDATTTFPALAQFVFFGYKLVREDAPVLGRLRGNN